MTPLWKKIRQTHDDGKVVTLEIPIETAGTPVKAFISPQLRGNKQITPETQVQFNLVMQKNIESGDVRYFIATFIPDPSCHDERCCMNVPYYFMKDPTFTGYVVISDVEGRALATYQHKEGHHRMVGLRAPDKNSTADTTEVLDRIALFTPLSQMMTSRGNLETDPDAGSYCVTCNQFVPTGTSHSGCEVVVVATPLCGSCGFPTDKCVCCSICGERPCVCNLPDNDTSVSDGTTSDGKPFKCVNPNCDLGEFCNGECLGSPCGPGGSVPLADNKLAANMLALILAELPSNVSSTIQTTLRTDKKITVSTQDALRYAAVLIRSVGGTSPTKYRIKVLTQDFREASPMGSRMLLFHEVSHAYLFELLGFNPTQSDTYNDLHHSHMISNARIMSWRKALFPGLTEEEYNMLKYAGAQGSPIFKNLPEEEQERIVEFFKAKEIIYDEK